MKTLTHDDVIVITGNNGLLGHAVVTTLGRRGDEDADGHPEVRRRVPQLIGLDRDGQPQPPPYCECVVFDVTDAESIALGLRRLAWRAIGQDAAGHLPGVPDPFIKPWMIEQADSHYRLDISAARRDLRWEPKHRLLDTLPSMTEALVRDPDAWYARHQLGKTPRRNAPRPDAPGVLPVPP